MCAEKRELLSWVKDVSKVSGVETIIVKEHEFSRPLSETLLLFTLLITMTLAVSAAYYLKMPAGPQYLPEQLQNQTQPAADEPVLSEPTSTEAPTTTVLASTEPTSTEPPTSEPTTSTEATTTTTTSTTTSSTTSTSVKCGYDMEPPCYTDKGLKCEPGNSVGAEGLCHQLNCVKTVPSGNNDGSCGAFAMSYCDEAK
jgi:hypothetical protein